MQRILLIFIARKLFYFNKVIDLRKERLYSKFLYRKENIMAFWKTETWKDFIKWVAVLYATLKDL